MRYGETRTVKLYYTISEVVDMTGIPAHILRYWEQEFPTLRPRKNRAGNRTYKERDIALIRRIQQLVQIEKFTLAGARKRLSEQEDLVEAPLPLEAEEAPDALDAPEICANPEAERKTAILGELQQIRDLLRSV